MAATPRLDEIDWPAARSIIASGGRAATAKPRSTSATPITQARRSPRGNSFSAATIAEISRTQARPIAPAATSSTINAQQQPRQ
jgi:hypothetical protein